MGDIAIGMIVGAAIAIVSAIATMISLRIYTNGRLAYDQPLNGAVEASKTFNTAEPPIPVHPNQRRRTMWD